MLKRYGTKIESYELSPLGYVDVISSNAVKIPNSMLSKLEKESAYEFGGGLYIKKMVNGREVIIPALNCYQFSPRRVGVNFSLIRFPSGSFPNRDVHKDDHEILSPNILPTIYKLVGNDGFLIINGVNELTKQN